MGTIGDVPRSDSRGLVPGLRKAMARWLSGRDAADVGASDPAGPRPRFRVVCIAREAGAGGSALGRMVAERLGWTVYDARIVEAIADRMERPVEQVEALDELSPSVVQDWLLPLRSTTSFGGETDDGRRCKRPWSRQSASFAMRSGPGCRCPKR